LRSDGKLEEFVGKEKQKKAKKRLFFLSLISVVLLKGKPRNSVIFWVGGGAVQMVIVKRGQNCVWRAAKRNQEKCSSGPTAMKGSGGLVR
jgi:hypothetical protein